MARAVAQRRGAAFTPPAAWPDRPRQVWKVQVGEGHASPIVAGRSRLSCSREPADTGSRDGADLATGKEIWREAYDAPYTMNSAATGHGKGPKSTPRASIAGGSTRLASAASSRRGRLQSGDCSGAGFQEGLSIDVAGLWRGDVADRRRRQVDRARRRDWQWRHAGARRDDRSHEVVVEGRGPAYASPIVADVRRVRARSSRRHSSTSSALAAGRRPAALADSVRDRLRAELRDAGRRPATC